MIIVTAIVIVLIMEFQQELMLYQMIQTMEEQVVFVEDIEEIKVSII